MPVGKSKPTPKMAHNPHRESPSGCLYTSSLWCRPAGRGRGLFGCTPPRDCQRRCQMSRCERTRGNRLRSPDTVRESRPLRSKQGVTRIVCICLEGGLRVGKAQNEGAAMCARFRKNACSAVATCSLSGNVKALFLARTAPDRVAAPARKIKCSWGEHCD